MSSPKVTIGMPAYNRADVLRSTIDQVLEQTFVDFELIIFNDGSKDHTSEVVRSFKDDRIVFLDNNSNLGPPHPLNAILKQAKGEYIVILHDHDLFHPRLIELSVSALENNPLAGFVLQGCAWIDEDGRSNYRSQLLGLPEYNIGYDFGLKLLADVESSSSIFHACSMVRRKVHEEVGLNYDECFGLYSDLDLWLRLLLITDFIYINEVLFTFRQRETVGHFLGERAYEIADWIFAIHVKNIHRYFPDCGNQRDLLLANAKRKWRKQVLIATFKYAANDNERLFLKGLLVLSPTNCGAINKRLYSTLVGIKPLRSFFVLLFSRLNRLRKWIKH